MKSLRRLVPHWLVLRPALARGALSGGVAGAAAPQDGAGSHPGPPARRPGPSARHSGRTPKASGNGAMTVDVPGTTVVAKGMLGTSSVLLVRRSGWANFLVASITSATGKERRSTNIRATSR